jgi:Glutathione synthase/Ribosomal protein S6 modification enzyme (glutaminyl transferase)
MKNSQRSYLSIIKEICEEEKIKIQTYSDNWIFRLEKDKKYRHILGYRFELNTSASEHICNDKSATSDILTTAKIPCVEHSFFLSPNNLKYLDVQGNWERMMTILKDNEKIVCKPNDGSGGQDVYLVTNQTMLENSTHKLFMSNRGIALCPFYDILNEYRTIVLDNEIKLIYKKIIPYVIGDGISTTLQLIAASKEKYKLAELGEYIRYYNVPLAGELVRLNWRHNLGQGAMAEEVSDRKMIEKLSTLALKTANVLNVRFAAIDIIETKEEIKILEVNSGIMMEHYSKINDETYEIAKDIYKEAIIKMFE